MAAGPSGYREINATAEKALDILMMFSEDTPAVTAVEVAAHLNVARSTAYRYLQSLVRTGFIEERSGAPGFRLGPRILQLAKLAARSGGLNEIAAPLLRDLVTATGHTAILCRLAGSTVVCLDEQVPEGLAPQVRRERGTILPTHTGAPAYALLAWLPPAELDDVLRTVAWTAYTDRSTTTVAALHQRLAETRITGYAIARGEVDPAVIGISAPVRGLKEEVFATVGIEALESRVSNAEAERLVFLVQRVADELSRRVRDSFSTT